MNEDINFILKNLQELRKIYPEIVSLVDAWQQVANVHGFASTENQQKVLKKYVKILTNLGVIVE